MKKLLTVLTLFLAFTVSVNAQSKIATNDETIKELAIVDTKALAEVLELTSQQETDFINLFVYKHKELSHKLSDERKAILSDVIKKKIEASLNAENLSRLAKNPKLLEQVSN
jgi:hypothetical protein